MDRIYIGMVDCARGVLDDILAAACLSPDEHERMLRLRRPLATRCFVEGRRLARQMTASLAGCAPTDLACAVDASGKPFFPSQPDWHFNITHSGTLAACVCAQFPLGLDIEYHKPGRNRLEIADRYFSPTETAAIRADMQRPNGTPDSDPKPDTPRRFYHYWALKEAWLKWHGIGLGGLADVPEYRFPSAPMGSDPVGEPQPERALRRFDGLPPDGCFAVWDVIRQQTHSTHQPSAGHASDVWSMALAASRPWRLEWVDQFAIGALSDLALEPVATW